MPCNHGFLFIADDEQKAPVGKEPDEKTADGRLGMMLAECSFAFLGWSYVKTESKVFE